MKDKLYILRIPSYQKIQIKPIKYAHTLNIDNVSASDLNPLAFFIMACFKQMYWCYHD